MKDQNKLEDILVLHLEGGKDFFISVSGNYIVSSFGQSLDRLVQLHVPIREVPTDKLVDISSSFTLVSTTWTSCVMCHRCRPSRNGRDSPGKTALVPLASRYEICPGMSQIFSVF